MSNSRSVKIFDLADAPQEVREGEDFEPLRPTPGERDGILVAITAGHYESDDGSGSITREVTYSEYCLHLWLMSSGADFGELVLLRWTNPAIKPSSLRPRAKAVVPLATVPAPLLE